MVRGSSEVDEVELAAALRRLGRAGDILVGLLVAAAQRIAAMRSEAAIVDLRALRNRRVQRNDLVLGRAACARPRDRHVALVAALLLAALVALNLMEQDQGVLARRLATRGAAVD